MKSRTVKVIVLLVSLLVLNIEAAHAGITHRVRILISHEFSDFQLLYMGGGLLTLGFLSYVIFMPAFKNERLKKPGSTVYFKAPSRRSYRLRRNKVKKISEILHSAGQGN